MNSPRWILIAFFGLLAHMSICAGQEPNDSVSLRKAVVEGISSTDDKSEDVAKFYKRIGVEGIKKLADDPDLGIAVQAAWEKHKVVVERPSRTVGDRKIRDWGYDGDSMKQFFKAFAKRTGVEPPEWWKSALLRANAGSTAHSFPSRKADLPVAKVEKSDNSVTITQEKDSIIISKESYDKAKGFVDIGTSPRMLWGPAQTYFARPVFRAYPFGMGCVETKTGKILWTATVWAARRGDSSGLNDFMPVEMRCVGDMVVIFGCESHGAFAEGFDVETGRARFRFCTCYWFEFSERWGGNPVPEEKGGL